MLKHFPLTNGIGLLYNHFSTNSFPFNQAVSPILHQVFTHREYLFSSDEESKNENSNRNDRARSSLLPQVRGLVHTERCRRSSNHLSIVQKSALDVAAKVQQEKRNRIQGQLIQFSKLGALKVFGDWVKLQRKIRLNEIYQMKPFSPGQAWIDLILRATWQDEKVGLKRGVSVPLQRGQFYCSYRNLALDWGWSRSGVERFMHQLIQRDMIRSVNSGTLTGTVNGTVKSLDSGTVKSLDSGTVKNKITSVFYVVNWEDYQDSGTVKSLDSGTVKSENLGHSPGHSPGQSTRYIRNKEYKEKSNGAFSEKSKAPEAEPAPVRAKAKLVI